MTRRYSDIDLTFIPHPVTGDVVKRYDENAVKLSVTNLILTQRYERPFHPELSSRASDLLFEPLSSDISIIIASTVKEVINNHEPRAEVVKVEAVANDSKNGYQVQIRFRLVNQPEPVTLNIFLHRVR